MKKSFLQNTGKQFRIDLSAMKKIILPLLFFIVMTGLQAVAQTSAVTVRFANPQFIPVTQAYTVDVELQSDTPDQQLFGMNVRFFYDDDVLEFISMGDFAEGYAAVSPDPPVIKTSGKASRGSEMFGFEGPAEFVNGAIQMVSTSSVYLSTTEWTRLFTISFRIDDPEGLGIPDFCPCLVWDLEETRGSGGFLNGDEGVVITAVAAPPAQSVPVNENVVQFNWQYDSSRAGSAGNRSPGECVSTIEVMVPVSNWAVFLSIGLMLAVTVFIYRRRISG